MSTLSPCCAPTSNAKPAHAKQDMENGERRVPKNAVAISGGASLVGTASPKISEDGEGPLQKTRVKPFQIGATAVSNEEFPGLFNRRDTLRMPNDLAGHLYSGRMFLRTPLKPRLFPARNGGANSMAPDGTALMVGASPCRTTRSCMSPGTTRTPMLPG